MGDKDIIKRIVLEISNVKIELTMDQAKQLHDELRSLFNKDNPDSTIIPYFPYPYPYPNPWYIHTSGDSLFFFDQSA